jgi:hypothetical protein
MRLWRTELLVAKRRSVSSAACSLHRLIIIVTIGSSSPSPGPMSPSYPLSYIPPAGTCVHVLQASSNHFSTCPGILRRRIGS